MCLLNVHRRSPMDTSLKRVGNNKFNAMLVASGFTGKSDSPTLLLHFVEENTASTVFVASDAAHEQLAQLELWRIYDMEVSGKCVKRARVPSRVGVRGLYEVVLKFPLKQLSLSKRASVHGHSIMVTSSFRGVLSTSKKVVASWMWPALL